MRNKSLYLSVIICLSLPNITSADVLFDCISYAEGYYGNTKAFPEKYFKKSCDLYSKSGCYKLGYLFENPNGKVHDFVNARKYYEKACNLNHPKGCDDYRRLLQLNDNSNNNIYRSSIQDNDEANCTILIQAKKYTEALPLCIKACDSNIAQICTVIGYLYNTGYGVDQSYKNAGKYYKKSCDLNDEGGCHLLGELYENPTGTGHDYVNARIYYNKSCDLKHGPACVSLGNLYNKGHGVAQSFAKLN